MLDAKGLLARAVEILQGGSSWVKYDNAVDGEGKFSPIHNKNSVKWDIYAALRKAHEESGNPTWKEWQEAYKMAKDAIPQSFRNRDIEDWNDYGDFAAAIGILGGVAGPNQPEPTVGVLGTHSGDLIVFSGDVLIAV